MKTHPGFSCASALQVLKALLLVAFFVLSSWYGDDDIDDGDDGFNNVDDDFYDGDDGFDD